MSTRTRNSKRAKHFIYFYFNRMNKNMIMLCSWSIPFYGSCSYSWPWSIHVLIHGSWSFSSMVLFMFSSMFLFMVLFMFMVHVYGSCSLYVHGSWSIHSIFVFHVLIHSHSLPWSYSWSLPCSYSFHDHVLIHWNG